MKPQSSPPKAHSEIEIVRLMWLAIFISVFSFLFYFRHGDVLLYGDAVAHINIARRVFDSRTPGLLQLGTVWLPLPHLLILPVHRLEADVAKRLGWLDSLDGSVCVRRAGNIPPGAYGTGAATAKGIMRRRWAHGRQRFCMPRIRI